jgi:hypothetical protein
MEWVGGAVLIGWSLGLAYQPATFDVSPSFNMLASFATESMWPGLCLIAGAVRLFALFINGTFRERFAYSPHLRACASFFAMLLWAQVTLGVTIAFLSGGAVTGIIAYGGYTLMEFINFFRSTSEAASPRTKK